MKHETASTMQPIKEIGNAAYFKRMYDIEGARPAKARELGNIHPGDGAKFCGMGRRAIDRSRQTLGATRKSCARSASSATISTSSRPPRR